MVVRQTRIKARDLHSEKWDLHFKIRIFLRLSHSILGRVNIYIDWHYRNERTRQLGIRAKIWQESDEEMSVL